jgi:alkanesulfonate monooxygenase SsuD/methylene tetrahydromethanopterin reductase-like flavin-dependent oxidoreductase (luciferase family)
MEVAADRRSSAGQLEHIQQLQAQQEILVAELEAARALVAQEERHQPTAQEPQPPPQQPQPPVITQLTQPTAAQQATRQAAPERNQKLQQRRVAVIIAVYSTCPPNRTGHVGDGCTSTCNGILPLST